MFSPNRLRSTVALCLSSAALVAVVAPAAAQASDQGVRTAIRGQDRAVRNSAAIKLATAYLNGTSKSPKGVKQALAVFETKLRKAVSVVSHKRASTARGRQGRAAWLGGVRKLIAGLADLRAALTAVQNHHAAQAKALVRKAAAEIKAGNVEGLKGDRLLGLSSGA